MRFFLCQVALYSVICLNLRAISQNNTALVIASDAIIAGLNFYAMRRIATTAKVGQSFLGYLLGSLAGTALGLAGARALGV